MNYFEHHIGDYAQATAHLSMLEDGAYSRLIRWYYAEERALPADERSVFRIARAQSKQERDAVKAVLADFFELQQDGYHQKRCDAEIAAFQDKRSKAQRSANARWSDRRPHSDGNANADANAQPDAMRTHSDGNANGMPRAGADGRVPQSPDPNHQPSSRATGGGRASTPTRPDGVSEQVWTDWLQLRKTKKAPVSLTVLEGAQEEAGKAGMPLEAFLRVWCTRGSQGLKAEWLKPEERNGRAVGSTDDIFAGAR